MRVITNIIKTILVVFNFAMISCQNNDNMKRFDYKTGNSRPNYYNIATYQQVMYSENDELIMIDGVGSLRSPWGGGGVTFIKNSEVGNPVPKILKVGYYSDTEDLFYEGEFQLPSAEIEKLLEEKSSDPAENKQKTIAAKYDRIEIGIALGGLVVMWVKGPGEQKEVGKFMAKTVDRNWSDIFENGTREDQVKYNIEKVFTKKVKEEVLTKTLPIDLWEKYRNKYTWNYTVNAPPNAKINSVFLKMINAEAETNYLNSSSSQPVKRAVPYQVEIRWSLDGKNYESRVVFAEDENYYKTLYKSTQASPENPYPADLTEEEVYQTFTKIDPNEHAELVISVLTGPEIKVNLKQKDATFNIKKIIGKTFQH